MNRFTSRKFILAVALAITAFWNSYTGQEIPWEAVVAILAFIGVEGVADIYKVKSL